MRGVLTRVLLLVGGLVAGLVLAEGAVRMLTLAVHNSVTDRIRVQDPLAVRIEPFGEYGYRQKPGSVYRYVNGTSARSNARGYRGPVVAVPKPAGVFRILILGGSSTHGWGVDDHQTIDAYMRAALRERFPGREIEVVNLGFEGYDSHQDLERLRVDGMPMSPDVIIVNNGINDVRNAQFEDLQDRDPRTLLFLSDIERLRRQQRDGHPALSDQIKHLSYLARVPGVVRDTRFNRRAFEARRVVTPNLAAADIFQRNLERISDVAGSVPVVLSTPPSALNSKYRSTDLSARSYWVVDAATTQHIRDELSRRMQIVARSASARGRRITDLRPSLESEADFFDDCHLTPRGNQELARQFVKAVEPYVVARASAHSSARTAAR